MATAKKLCGITHTSLVLTDGSYLYAGDAPAHLPFQAQSSVTITMSYETVTEAEQVFAALSNRGTVTMAMAESFWAKTFGMVTDRFDTSWAINGEPQPLVQQ